jgi:hypothetical protein
MEEREVHTTLYSEKLKERRHFGEYAYINDNLKMELRERGCEDLDSIHLAQSRDQWRTLVDTVMNIRIPYRSFLTS